MYDKVAPWGLLSCLLTSVSLCHGFCGCEQVSALSARLRLYAYVIVRAHGLSTSPDCFLGCLSPDPTGSLRGCSVHGNGVPADRSSRTRRPCLQLGPCLGGISCLWTQPLSHPGKVCQSSLHSYKMINSNHKNVKRVSHCFLNTGQAIYIVIDPFCKYQVMLIYDVNNKRGGSIKCSFN